MRMAGAGDSTITAFVAAGLTMLEEQAQSANSHARYAYGKARASIKSGSLKGDCGELDFGKSGMKFWEQFQGVGPTLAAEIVQMCQMGDFDSPPWTQAPGGGDWIPSPDDLAAIAAELPGIRKKEPAAKKRPRKESVGEGFAEPPPKKRTKKPSAGAVRLAKANEGAFLGSGSGEGGDQQAALATLSSKRICLTIGGGRTHTVTYKSGYYALLLALYRTSHGLARHPEMKTIRKDALIDQAQQYATESFTAPKMRGTVGAGQEKEMYTAWSNMGNCQDDGVIAKASNPPWYYLTEAGERAGKVLHDTHETRAMLLAQKAGEAVEGLFGVQQAEDGGAGVYAGHATAPSASKVVKSKSKDTSFPALQSPYPNSGKTSNVAIMIDLDDEEQDEVALVMMGSSSSAPARRITDDDFVSICSHSSEEAAQAWQDDNDGGALASASGSKHAELLLPIGAGHVSPHSRVRAQSGTFLLSGSQGRAARTSSSPAHAGSAFSASAGTGSGRAEADEGVGPAWARHLTRDRGESCGSGWAMRRLFSSPVPPSSARDDPTHVPHTAGQTVPLLLSARRVHGMAQQEGSVDAWTRPFYCEPFGNYPIPVPLPVKYGTTSGASTSALAVPLHHAPIPGAIVTVLVDTAEKVDTVFAAVENALNNPLYVPLSLRARVRAERCKLPTGDFLWVASVPPATSSSSAVPIVDVTRMHVPRAHLGMPAEACVPPVVGTCQPDMSLLSRTYPKTQYVLGYILERKRTDDFDHSIMGSRYEAQRDAMRACGLTRLLYLVENPLLNQTVSPSNFNPDVSSALHRSLPAATGPVELMEIVRRLKSAAVGTYAAAFQTVHTADLGGTGMEVARLTAAIAIQVAQRTDWAVQSNEFDVWRKHVRGVADQFAPRTVTTLLGAALLQAKMGNTRIRVNYVETIVSVFPTLQHLVRGLEAEPQETRDTLLRRIDPESSTVTPADQFSESKLTRAKKSAVTAAALERRSSLPGDREDDDEEGEGSLRGPFGGKKDRVSQAWSEYLASLLAPRLAPTG